MLKPECLWVKWSHEDITVFASFEIALVPQDFTGGQRVRLFQDYLESIYHPALIVELVDSSVLGAKTCLGVAKAFAQKRYRPDITDRIDGRTE